MPSSRRLLLPWICLVALLLAGGAAGAAETARYRVTFDATWSVATHPTDFPADPHFSPPLGATHTPLSSFWEAGLLASPGIQDMAETGSTSPLNQEMALGGARDVFVVSGRIDSPGVVEAEIDVFDTHTLVTLVSMVAPSPDWFVGVSGVPLRTGTAWVGSVVVPLSPYDAGTDSGVTFESPNQVTNPPEPIAPITGFPFVGAPPLGTFSFELVRVLAACENSLDDDGDGLLDGDDPGCSDPADASEQDPGIACDDGLDNDGDARADTDDPGCDDPADLSEKTPELVCDDGIDNDGDGPIDWPSDSGCLDLFDDTEEAIENAPSLAPVGAAAIAFMMAAAARARRASRSA